MEIAGLAIAPVLAVTGRNAVSTEVVVTALVCGALGGVGLVCFYQAMRDEAMGVIAPVTGVVAAGWPTTWGVVTGGRLHPVQYFGLLCGLSAIAMISLQSRTAATKRDVALAIMAGGCLGSGVILLNRSAAGGVWTLVATRLAALTVVGIAAAITGTEWLPTRCWRMIVAVGLLDGMAVSAFIIASYGGTLAIIAVLASLYPAVTVLLARTVTNERLRRRQLLGAGLALAAVGLMAGG
jgi:uncharacterized membrane protein